jgi:uncharacterized protein (TIGR00255 family)
MTGYACNIVQLQHKTITIELKTFNSKGIDISFKAPVEFRNQEIAIKNILAEKIIRGKTELIISLEYHADLLPVQINKTLLNAYIKELSQIAEENAITQPDLLSIAMRIPYVLDSNKEVLNDDEWESLKNHLSKTIDDLFVFRKKEGEKLQVDVIQRIKLIKEYAQQVMMLDPPRKEKLRTRLREQIISSLTNASQFNADRFEQEMIYYLEKIDITEELVRLKTHCDYFIEIVDEPSPEKGKKLGFVAQEIGREINTIGSKASDAAMQKIVVMMKDELEKIKEQLNNIL